MSKGTKPTPSISEVPEKVQVSKKQAEELKATEDKSIAVKVQICDLTEQIIIAERQRGALYDNLYQAQSEYRAKLNKIAILNGIDVDADPKETGYVWNYDSVTNTFTRIPVKQQ